MNACQIDSVGCAQQPLGVVSRRRRTGRQLAVQAQATQDATRTRRAEKAEGGRGQSASRFDTLSEHADRPQLTTAAAAAATAACAALFPEAASAALHFNSEPANALSLPTWAIHVASVVEWMIAMDLLWRLGDVQDRPAWRALVWGMLPLHASSLTACTYHLFYNSPSLAGLVTLQAGLTAFGNCTLLLGTLRVAESYEAKPDASGEGRGWTGGFQDIGASFSKPAEQEYLKKGAIASFAGAAAVKYGSLLFDFPFEPSYGSALALIFGGTALTGAAFGVRELTGGPPAGKKESGSSDLV